MTDRELLEQALEALVRGRPQIVGALVQQDQDAAITALRERLAQPEQEPVAWARFSDKGNIIDLLNEPDRSYTPLYTTPPRREWQGLTEEEIESCNQTTTDWGAPCVWLWDDTLEEGGIQFARAIEAKLREKNA